MGDLPSIIPLFPLPNFVLFPRVEVPLHIFEPRYREMIGDIATSHRTIGMTLLRGNWERDYYAYPDIFEVGCAGRIESLVELPDGRFDLRLMGVSEFRLIREIRERAYRQAEVSWFPADSGATKLSDHTMADLRRLLVEYLGEGGNRAWNGIVDERGLQGAELINFLCFHLDLNSLEKQTLLQALSQRVSCLLDILSFKLEERKFGPPGGSSSGPGFVQ